jgi:hypothetical protein
MKHFVMCLAILLVVLAANAAALAGPGDPRFVSGVLEWPRAVMNEPFLVVRGDDGGLYYVAITTARRDATLVAGARVAVLGLEGRTAHEINALGVGAGDSIESALANLTAAHSAPAASTPAVITPSVAAPTTPGVTVPSATAQSAPANGGAAAIAAPTVKAPGTPAPTATAPAPTITVPAPTVTAPTPNVATPTPGVVAPTPNGAALAPHAVAPAAPNAVAPPPNGTAPAPAVTPTTPAVGPYPSIISAPTASSVRSAAVSAPPKRPGADLSGTSVPMPVSASDDRRWTEITGVVESLVGRTLVLRSPEGRVAVDVSSLSSNLDRVVTPGTTVRVYGVPVEMRFKAMGFVDPGRP